MASLHARFTLLAKACMSLNHALLSALAETPGTGAELVKRFDQTYGHFWASTHQQIYRELKKLEADGWVSASPSDKKTGSVIYTLRPAGRKALVAWTLDSNSHATARDPFMVRLRAMANVDDADPETALLQARTRHLARLQHYEALHRKHFGPVDTPLADAPGAPLTRAKLLRQLVLDAGLRRERSQIDWCDASLQALRALAAQQAEQALATPAHAPVDGRLDAQVDAQMNAKPDGLAKPASRPRARRSAPSAANKPLP